ncbi:uncharacterized protein LOC117040301 [Lacerta agilis]|uniref:uncharacterized protein LOC117040301 n=1 Tax=Lacerta agilis TaxID=80427 RepID=UPI00141A5A74|nr:uncharacterized protein LOC117040301 [Lacerta agilis]
MERDLLCALVLLAALGGVAAGTEKVPRKDTFQSLEQLLGEEDFFSPDEIWLDDELSFSDSPLMAYLDNDEVEGIDWSGPVNGVDWDVNIIIIILVAAEIVCFGLCLYHPKLRHFLRSCCMRCHQWWCQYLCVPSVTRVLDIPPPYHGCKRRAPPLSAAAVLQVIMMSPSSSNAASDGTPWEEGVRLPPVTSEDRARRTSRHIPDILGVNIV